MRTFFYARADAHEEIVSSKILTMKTERTAHPIDLLRLYLVTIE
ncbi:MAG: hypothetical protein V4495_09850 [Pseudomonadota bacterium]